MLSRTLATNYAPGINLKHDLAGASWTYLMPHLELDQVVCIGAPTRAALKTLLRISQHITIAGQGAGMGDGAVENAAKIDVVADIASVLNQDPGSVDLIFLTNSGSVRRLYEDAHFQEQLVELMREDGLIYFELAPGTRLLDLQERLKPGKLRECFDSPQLLWLTPWHGEVETAVPVVDRRMVDYFFKHKLYSPSLTINSFKQRAGWRRRSKKRGSGGGKQKRGGSKSLLQQARASSRPLLRAIAAKTMKGFGQVERALLRSKRSMRRYGVFVQPHGGSGALDIAPPPSYLQSVAAAAGMDISEHRWGFSARGRYSSRKLLFYLFAAQEQNGEEPGNDYIVKMVRDPVYNERLENEYRALALLDELGVQGSAVYPKAEFLGYHNGLAIAGESHVDGVPFRAKTHATADCPYMREVISWLSYLGEATALRSTAAVQIAEAMEQLLASFVEIYRPSEEVYHFLSRQVALIAGFQGQIPLVFQHGDPGTWNIFVTRAGRVAFLDWESAEPQGMPLWDLFYFMRSYATWVARSSAKKDSLLAFRQQLLSEGPLAEVIVEATAQYCRQIAVAPELVEPLFYTCWMHRALKQATSLPVQRLNGGHYVNLLRLTIEQRESSPTLQRLFTDLGLINQSETG